jgi:hypothetical protein
MCMSIDERLELLKERQEALRRSFAINDRIVGARLGRLGRDFEECLASIKRLEARACR